MTAQKVRANKRTILGKWTKSNQKSEIISYQVGNKYMCFMKVTGTNTKFF